MRARLISVGGPLSLSLHRAPRSRRRKTAPGPKKPKRDDSGSLNLPGWPGGIISASPSIGQMSCEPCASSCVNRGAAGLGALGGGSNSFRTNL